MNKISPVSIVCTEESEKLSSLSELTQVEIDRNLSPALRVERFLADVGDPYHFTVNGTDVRIGFIGNNSLKTQLSCALSNMNKYSGYGNYARDITLTVPDGSTVA